MLIKEIPEAKSRILEILQHICNQEVDGKKEISTEDDSDGMFRVLKNYIANPRYNRKKYTMPAESNVENMELRKGWSEFDRLSDIDLWVDGEPSDLTAIFRIELSSKNNFPNVSLYDIKVL